MCPDTDPEAGKGSRQYRENSVDAGRIIQVKLGQDGRRGACFRVIFSKTEKCDFRNFFDNFSWPLFKNRSGHRGHEGQNGGHEDAVNRCKMPQGKKS